MSEAFAAEPPVSTPEVTVRPDPNDPNRGITDPLTRRTEMVGDGDGGALSPRAQSLILELDKRAQDGDLSPRAGELLAELKRRKGIQAPEAAPAASTETPQAEGIVNRTVGVAATGFNKGLGGWVDLVNEGLKGLGLPMSDQPFMGTAFVDKYLAGEQFQPQNVMERVLQRAGLEVGANVPLLAGAGAMQAAGVAKKAAGTQQAITGTSQLDVLRKLPEAITQQLAEISPQKLAVLESALAAGAGTGAEIVHELFPEGGPVAEFVGEVIGGFAPSVAIGLVRKSIDLAHGIGRVVLGVETDAEMKRRIGKTLQDAATPEQLAEGVTRAEELRQEVTPGAEKGQGLQLSAGSAVKAGSVSATERAEAEASVKIGAKLKDQRRQNVEEIQRYFNDTAPEGEPIKVVERLQQERAKKESLLDIGLARTEMRLAAARGELSRRQTALMSDLEAQMQAADQALDARLSVIGPSLRPQQRKDVIRMAYQDEVGKFRERSRADYAELDSLGHAELPISGTISKLGEIEDQFPAQLQAIRKINPRVASVIDRLGHDYELTQRVEKAQADLNVAGGDGPGSYPLMRFLRSRGGVQDQGGELLALLDKPGASGAGPGRPAFRRPGGMTLDQAAEAAFDAGKIKERSIQSLLDSISLENSGRGGMYPAWYQGLITGKNPLEHATIVKALDAIKTGNAHDLQADTIAHVKKAIMADSEFRKSPWFEPVMDELQNTPSASLKDLRNLRSDLLKLARDSRAKGDGVQNYVLQEMLGGVDQDIDQLLPDASAYSKFYPNHGTLYRAISADYREGVATLFKGQVGKLHAVGADGSYRVDEGSVPALFWKDETSLDQFLKAFSSQPDAQIALRDFALDDLYWNVVKPVDLGKYQVDPKALQRWLDLHREKLKAFPDLEPTFRDAAALQKHFDGLEQQMKQWTAGQKGVERMNQLLAKESRPGDFHPADVDRANAKLAQVESIVKRTRHDWERSKAALFLQQDPRIAANSIVADKESLKAYEAVAAKLKGDPEALAGLNKSVWYSITDKMAPRLIGVGGDVNMGVLHKTLQDMLTAHGPLMQRVLGPEGYKRIEVASEVVEKIATGSKSVSDTAVNLQVHAALASSWLSRGWAALSGRVPIGFGAAERGMQWLLKTLEKHTREQQEKILLEAFTNPKMFQTLVNAAQYGPENALVRNQMAQHLHMLNLSEQTEKEGAK